MTQAAIEQSTKSLLGMTQVLSSLMDAERHGTTQLTPRYTGIIATHAIRQGEAIAQLAPHDRRVFQISQLVRGLVATHVILAWLVYPDDDEERVRRAVRFRIDDLTEEKKKALDRLGLGFRVPDEFWVSHAQAVENVWRRADTKGLGLVSVKLPSIKKMCQQIDMPELYSVYQAESSAAHVGSTTIGGYVRSSESIYLVVGGPDPIEQRILRLTRAIAAMQAIGAVTVSELGLDADKWVEASQTALDAASVMMGLLD